MKQDFLSRTLVFMVLVGGWFLPEPAAGGNWDTALLNTALEANYLSEPEKRVILEINKLRSDPASYAREYLEPLAVSYQGNRLLLSGKMVVLTKEGLAALSEAIRFLKNTPPVALLSPDLRLSQATRDHRIDQSDHGGTGHMGSNGSATHSRIRKYGKIAKAYGENIFYGEEDPRMVVIHLLIDDGHPGRGHRLNLLDRDYRLIGVAMGSHPVWKYVCVMDFADAMK
jgi:uncharacterized protein YkwD